MEFLISGYESVFLLSQYIGEFHPAAHLNGLFGCKIIAFICNNDLATCFAISISYIMTQKYKVYVNNKPKLITDNWISFCSHYKLIKAAGGVVYNHNNQLLMILKNGKWDLPKGKIEEGEDIKACAIREVEEECGVRGLLITQRLIDTYHTYQLNGEKILKHTYWFKMKTNFNGMLIPQSEERITQVCWVNKDEIINKLNNSFKNLSEILRV